MTKPNGVGDFYRRVNYRGPYPERRELGRCWIWTGRLGTAGYGSMPLGGRTRRVHDLAYELAFGPIPPGLEPDHLCRVRNCVNPNHLEAVTHRENMLRSPVAPSAINSRKTHCPRGHAYDEANTRLYRGSRYCLACEHLRPRIGRPRKTHCPHGHEFTPENTYVRGDGARCCRTCKREQNLRSWHRRAAARRAA